MNTFDYVLIIVYVIVTIFESFEMGREYERR